MTIEIVDFPMKNGGSSIVFCKRLPEGSFTAHGWNLGFSPLDSSTPRDTGGPKKAVVGFPRPSEEPMYLCGWWPIPAQDYDHLQWMVVWAIMSLCWSLNQPEILFFLLVDTCWHLKLHSKRPWNPHDITNIIKYYGNIHSHIKPSYYITWAHKW